jgi:hypothetical protein
MPLWEWVLVGIGAWVAGSIVLVAALAGFFRLLRRVSADEAEADAWATQAPHREPDEAEEPVKPSAVRRRIRARRR